jgi:VanZ family protein
VRRALPWVPALAYMALIWTLSSMPLDLDLTHVPLRDKGVHLVEYAVLGLLLASAARRTWPDRSLWRTALVAALLATLFGLSDELHQALVPGREADGLDLLADAVGSTAGAAAYAVYRAVRGVAVPREQKA